MEQDEKDFLISILQDVCEAKSLTNVLKILVDITYSIFAEFRV